MATAIALYGPDGRPWRSPNANKPDSGIAPKAAAAAGAARYMEEFRVADLLRRLDAMPARIREQKEAAARARVRREEAEQAVLLLEAEMTAAIAAETGANGRPKYANQEARAAELAVRKSLNPAWRQVADAARRAKEECDAAVFNLEMLQDEFKALRSMADLAASALRIL